MTPVDLALLALALLAALLGWQQGFLAGGGAVAGFVVGLVAGRFLGPWAADILTGAGVLDASAEPGLTVALPLVLGVVLSGVGGFVGASLRDRIPSRWGRGVDALGGGASGLVAFTLIVWLAAGWIATTPLLTPNRWAAESAIIAALDRYAPITSTEALGEIGTALADTGFPQVFQGQPEQIRGVGEPNEAMVAVGRDVDDSVVKIVTTVTECGTLQEGTGWVYSSGLVATNAHVVAGAQALSVQVGGTGHPYSGDVVAFDPALDVAVLRVPELAAPELEFGSTLTVGADSVVVGFPENGPYTISPTRVRDRLDARGLDIYNDDTVVREVYSMRGIIRPGNSGGPMLDSQGRVVGMVFAKSATDPETGYALTLDEIDGVLRDAQERTRPVDTRSCAVQSPPAG
ncbi:MULTISPECIES: MarP family serine protease [unclassified Brevibacterium]|uniref:MarP family serine protease n=1 Tax=unclassified Brevibacterium TaxID=2614124 RepID=UPI0010C78DC8|nr:MULTISPECIES: MarP family serine protease [unclassified Brevibacterium]MCK1802909.1 MarP family serine protease [Brevibacterium sp. R8603A2]QCP04151.1 MarP family serine protease [Brevibacterium sp. CS2]